MNNKFNFSRSSPGDASMRFNKRPRYGPNNSAKFSQQNQSSYNYQQNRHNMSSSVSYQHNQFEQRTRNCYGQGSPKTPINKLKQQRNKSSPHTHFLQKLPTSSISSSPSTPNNIKLPPQPTTPQSATAAQQNQQQQSIINVSQNVTDYSFAYNNYFYPNYNTDAVTLASSYGMTDSISPFMWQTITTTPPPNMLHKTPLPQQLPPTQLPPLPSNNTLPSIQTESNVMENAKESGNLRDSCPLVKIKTKRKAISSRYNLSKTWSQEDAELALKAEQDNMNRQQKDVILILRFPDPEISRDIVKSYDPAIESVHFQLNFAPRYCFVHLKTGTDVEQTIETLSKIPFGSGFIKAEIKDLPSKPHTAKPCEIDPCTLYVGNLPTTIASKVLKEHFPGAVRYDIGFAQRMKYTRYAFIRYKNVQQAVEVYKRKTDAEIGGRSIILRFRRIATTKEDQKDDAENLDDLQGDEDMADDMQPTITSQNDENNTDIIGPPQEENQSQESSSRNNSCYLDKNMDADKDPIIEGHPVESISKDLNTSTENNRTISISSEKSLATSNSSIPTTASSIKPDPDVDPTDVVVRDDTITSRFDYYNDSIKKEKELDIYFEFFATTSDTRNKKTGKANMIEISSSAATTDDCNETPDSGSSLGEFLRNCQVEHQSKDNINNNLQPPPTKKFKNTNKVLEKQIKTEPLVKQKPVTATAAIKQELNNINEDYAAISDICTATTLPKELRIIRHKAKQMAGTTLNVNVQNISTNNDEILPQKDKKKQQSAILGKKKKVTNIMEKFNKHKSGTLCNSPSQNLPEDDDDDLVPTDLLLLLRGDLENSVTDQTDEIYDELFSTTTKKHSKPNTSIAEVKQEPVESSRKAVRTNDKTTTSSKKTITDANQLMLQETTTKLKTSQSSLKPNKDQNKLSKIEKLTQPKQIKPNTSTSFSSNDLKNQLNLPDEEDDLVPENNCLNSNQTVEIKQEQDLDDIFSVDFKTTNHENNKGLDYIRHNDATKHSNTSLNINAAEVSVEESENPMQYAQLSNKCPTENNEKSHDDDDDDDCTIISDNLTPTKPTALAESPFNSFGRSQPLAFNSKPADPYDKSFFESYHRNKLEKLFKILDSDSDSDLEL